MKKKNLFVLTVIFFLFSCQGNGSVANLSIPLFEQNNGKLFDINIKEGGGVKGFFKNLFSSEKDKKEDSSQKESSGDSSKKKEQSMAKASSEEYAKYISFHTTGTISSLDDIVIQLNKKPVKGLTDLSKVVNLSPFPGGTFSFTESNQIIFKAAKGLESKRLYSVEVDLNQLFNMAKPIASYEFEFNIINQSFEVTFNDLAFTDSGADSFQIVSGEVETADRADHSRVEKMLSLADGRKKLKVEWNHASNGLSHQFLIDTIIRKKKPYQVTASWNGKSIHVDAKGSRKFDVYSIGDFSYVGYNVQNKPEKKVVVEFSMFLDPKQTLSGIVKVKNDKKAKILIEENCLTIFPGSRSTEKMDVFISKNLRDYFGGKIPSDVNFGISFKSNNPKVSWIQRGGIIPATKKGIILPFNATAVDAVDLTVVQVFEKNIVQFMQDNDKLTGSRNIKRVGRPIVSKTISLKDYESKNLFEKNTFSLDLSELTTLDSGALYQITLNIRRSQSLYICPHNNPAHAVSDDSIDIGNWDYSEVKKENSSWDYYGQYYGNNDSSWKNRKDPCFDAFYEGQKRAVSINVLASNFGIIVKANEKGDYRAIISDLITAKPLEDVSVSFLNYQGKKIVSGKSDKNGFYLTQIDLSKGVPFAVIVSKGKSRGYLKIDYAASISLSNFDVGGITSPDGIRGFLYADRGVWCPGDTVHLNFILSDKESVLPAGHPIQYEIIDPKGTIYQNQIEEKGNCPIYNFDTVISEDAPTGNWIARVNAGNAFFSKVIKIEVVKPNRLKFDMDFGREMLSLQDGSVKGNIKASWLHGAPANKLKSEFDLFLTPIRTRFSNYRDYLFDDPAKEFKGSVEQIYRGKLDEKGEASIMVNIGKQDSASGFLNAYFSGKVYEPGGDFSIDAFNIPYAPYDAFTGMIVPKGDKARGMLLTDVKHPISFVSVDAYGKPLAGRQIEFSLYKLSWKWWWDKTEDNYSNYVNDQYKRPVLKGKAKSDQNGQGKWEFEIKYPSWGRYYLRAKDTQSGHSSGKVVYIDWPGWAGTAQKENMSASVLSFFADDVEYNVGEKIALTIPATSAGGRALITLENGTDIVDSYWVNTADKQTALKIPVTEKMLPSIYVNVVYVQPYNKKNDLPMRLFGILPLKIISPKTILKPQLKVDGTLAPESKVSFTISEKNGKAMYYTVAVVDDGLLGLTNYHTPDPHGSFYSKESLKIRTWDMYDLLAGQNGEIFGPLLSIGGSDSLKKAGSNEANKFEPVIKFFGPYRLEAGKSKTTSYMMPRYVGSVRTMVVAASESAYGMAEKSSFVKEDLMVLPSFPSEIGPGERCTLPVNVFCYVAQNDPVSISVRTEGPISVEGKKLKQLLFREKGDKLVSFNIVSKKSLGEGKLFISVSSATSKVTSQLEVTVSPVNPQITRVQSIFLKPGENHSFDVLPFGISNSQKQTIEVSKIKPLNLTKRLDYLIKYPHGCIEQTTSGVFPQLFLPQITELSADQQKNVASNIVAGIQSIEGFQTSDGGLSYWPGQTSVHEWGTNYAGHFIVAAKKSGYSVSESFLSSWVEYQTNVADEWNGSSANGSRSNQAYRLFTLAYSGNAAFGAMNRFMEEDKLSSLDKWLLSAAFYLSGNKDIAKRFTAKAGFPDTNDSNSAATFGSTLRDKAMVLYILSLMGDYVRGVDLNDEISDELNKKGWMSTQTTAYCLMGASAFSSSLSNSTQALLFADYGSGKKRISFSQDYYSLPINKISSKFAFSNVGKAAIYIKVINSGIPYESDEENASSNLNMKITYFDSESGKALSSIGKLSQGKDLLVEVIIEHPGERQDYNELALTHHLPSGWKILNARLNTDENILGNDAFDYQDIRENEILTYFDLKKGEKKVFKYLINSSYLGKYYLPTIKCEAMYDNTVSAVEKGFWTEVQ